MNYADYIDSLTTSALETRLAGGKPFEAHGPSFIKPRAVPIRARQDPQAAVEPC